jgi:hypothetical protein
MPNDLDIFILLSALVVSIPLWIIGIALSTLADILSKR